MLFKIRSNAFTFYRFLFISLFILMGVSGIGCVLLENMASLEIFSVTSASDRDALHATSIVMGIIGFSVAALMIYLMQERRNFKVERRQNDQQVNFADRRNNIDRRNSAIN